MGKCTCIFGVFKSKTALLMLQAFVSHEQFKASISILQLPNQRFGVATLRRLLWKCNWKHLATLLKGTSLTPRTGGIKNNGTPISDMHMTGWIVKLTLQLCNMKGASAIIILAFFSLHSSNYEILDVGNFIDWLCYLTLGYVCRVTMHTSGCVQRTASDLHWRVIYV